MRKFVMTGPAVCLLMLFAAGCGILAPEPSYPTSYYTLGAPEETFDRELAVRQIANVSGAGRRMQYLISGHAVVIDEYRRWDQPPEQLIANYLRRSFRYGDPDALDATLFLWEADLVECTASLGIEVSLTVRSGGEPVRRRLIYSVKFPETTPEAIAQAFTECAQNLAHDLKELAQ